LLRLPKDGQLTLTGLPIRPNSTAVLLSSGQTVSWRWEGSGADGGADSGADSGVNRAVIFSLPPGLVEAEVPVIQVETL